MSVVWGFVFGMSRMVVTPPAAAAFEPEKKSSLYSNPCSLICTWPSIRPGKTSFPLTSMMFLSLEKDEEIFFMNLSWIVMCLFTCLPFSIRPAFFMTDDVLCFLVFVDAVFLAIFIICALHALPDFKYRFWIFKMFIIKYFLYLAVSYYILPRTSARSACLIGMPFFACWK